MPEQYEHISQAAVDRLRAWMAMLSGEHPAVTYTADGYKIWLKALAGQMLDAAGVPALLDVAEAAQDAQRFADNEMRCRLDCRYAEPGDGGEAAIALSNAITFREVADRTLEAALAALNEISKGE